MPHIAFILSMLGAPAALTQPDADARCAGTYVAPTIVVFDAACATPSISDTLYIGESEEPTDIAGVGRLASGRLVVYVNPNQVEL